MTNVPVHKKAASHSNNGYPSGRRKAAHKRPKNRRQASNKGHPVSSAASYRKSHKAKTAHPGNSRRQARPSPKTARSKAMESPVGQGRKAAPNSGHQGNRGRSNQNRQRKDEYQPIDNNKKQQRAASVAAFCLSRLPAVFSRHQWFWGSQCMHQQCHADNKIHHQRQHRAPL